MRNGNSGTKRQAHSRMKRKYHYILIIQEVYYRKEVSKISMNSYLSIREFSACILCNSTRSELIYLIRKMQMHFRKVLKSALFIWFHFYSEATFVPLLWLSFRSWPFLKKREANCISVWKPLSSVIQNFISWTANTQIWSSPNTVSALSLVAFAQPIWSQEHKNWGFCYSWFFYLFFHLGIAQAGYGKKKLIPSISAHSNEEHLVLGEM